MRKSLSVCVYADELNWKSLSAARWRTQMTPGIRQRARQAGRSGTSDSWAVQATKMERQSSQAANVDGCISSSLSRKEAKMLLAMPLCVWTRDKCPACDVTDNSRLDNNPLCTRGTAEPRRRRRHHCARAKLIKSGAPSWFSSWWTLCASAAGVF